MTISKLSGRAAAMRFLSYVAAAALVTAPLAMVAIFASERWSAVLVAAFSGQIALTLVKLFFYLGTATLCLAFIARKYRPIFGPLHWAGDQLASVAYANCSVIVGVLAGLILATAVTLGSAGVVTIGKAIVTLSVIAAILWVVASAPTHATKVTIAWQAFGLSAIAAIVLAVSLTSLYCEPWVEVAGSHSVETAGICHYYE